MNEFKDGPKLNDAGWARISYIYQTEKSYVCVQRSAVNVSGVKTGSFWQL